MTRLAVLFFILVSIGGFAQDSVVQSIVLKGIELHDNGDYQGALKEYERALDLDPKSALINYEIALSYYHLQEPEKAIKYAKAATKETSESGLQAVILLGSIYDQQGEGKKSLKVLEDALDDYGDYYLLWYNYGVTATGQNKLDKAEKAFLAAVENKLDHINSHFALGRIWLAQERRAEGIYPMLFCLLLDPKGDRSPVVYKSVEQAFGAGVVRENDSTTTITLSVGKEEGGAAMRSAELMLSMLEASRTLEEYDTLSKDEVDIELMRSFLTFMTELEMTGRDDFFTRYYVPFFGAIAKSDHMETFFHYIRMASSEASSLFCENEQEALGAFFDWLDTVKLDE